MARSERNIENLTGSVDGLQLSAADLKTSVADLAVVLRESMKLSDDRFSRFDDRLAKLAEAQKTTEERLNALISVVDRHITGPDHAPRR